MFQSTIDKEELKKLPLKAFQGGIHVIDSMADLKKYREGETLMNGALLEKIHPGSIQLNYEGTRFRVDR